MIVLTADEIILLHEKLIAATGGSPGLRDWGLLESATYSVNSGFDETEQYPAVPEKAARFAYALIQNHAFVDGNKRIGILVMLSTLRMNSIEIRYTQQELLHLGLGIANGALNYARILTWIEQHMAE